MKTIRVFHRNLKGQVSLTAALIFEADVVRIDTKKSTRSISYERIRNVFVRYAPGYTGMFIDCSPKAVQLVVEDVDGEVTEIRGDLAAIAPLAGELRTRVRAANPAAEPGSHASDREIRLEQKQEYSRKERKVGNLGTVFCGGVLLVLIAVEVLFLFASERVAASITEIQEFPKSYRIQFRFSESFQEYRGDCRASYAELPSLRKKGAVDIEYLSFSPVFNRRTEGPMRTVTFWLAVIMSVMFIASLILKSGVVPARADGRFVPVRPGELEEDYYRWYRDLLKSEENELP